MNKADRDKNFDGLTSRFQERIYGTRKGRIRLSVIERDLNIFSPYKNIEKPLKVLDLGAGAGHFSIEFAKYGHEVWYNDISEEMFELAFHIAAQQALDSDIHWHKNSYQNLLEDKKIQNIKFDLVLCHGLIEWLEKPQKLLQRLPSNLKKGSRFSICFYNPAGNIYRNLMRGNFRYVDTLSEQMPDSGSFTPRSNISLQDIKKWLSLHEFSIDDYSGIRVFSDYTKENRGGLLNEAEIILQELKFSQLSPYRELGRYIHVMATKL